MLNKYRLFQRAKGVFYWQDNESAKQGSLRTKNRRSAEKLLHPRNEGHRLPTLNLTMARAYTFRARREDEHAHLDGRHARDGHPRHRLQPRTLRANLLLESVRFGPPQAPRPDNGRGHSNGHSVAHYLRGLHNLACDLGWLAWPILAKRVWPKIRSKHRRAVTAEEHAKIIASEKNPEKRAYYEFLYETGAAQSDAAELTAENIDWQNGLLVYHRKKLGPDSEPVRLNIGAKLRELLESLPQSGDLFPTIKRAKPNARSTEFRRRCRIAGVSGVSLPQLSTFLGAACQSVRLSATICPGRARTQQPRRA